MQFSYSCAVHVYVRYSAADELPASVPGDAPGLATVDRLPDPAAGRLDAIWDEEWKKHLLSLALEEVKRQVSDRRFQIFDLHVLQQRPVREVARMLGVTAARVYLAKHPIGALLRKELRKLESHGP